MALRLTMQEPNANLASHREMVFASGQPKLRRGALLRVRDTQKRVPPSTVP